MRSLVVAVALVVATSGCERPAPAPPAASPAPSVTAAERPPTRPGPRVENRALGRSRPLVRRAIADLKRLGVWDDLTDHLYIVAISSREGTEAIPKDEHLADALFTATIDRDGSGALCDIRFYPAALELDLSRQRRFFETYGTRRPPGPRAFWAAILAHELGHCLPGFTDDRGLPIQPGEKVARRWEARVLRRLHRAES